MQINGFVWDEAVSEPRATGRRHPFVLALIALVGAECALLAVATIYLVIEIITAPASSVVSAVALTALTAIAAVWLFVITVNIARGRAWTRGATVVWQVLQIAVAIGSFQGLFARPDIGWLLLVPSLVVLGLLFSKPVTAAISGRDGS